MKQEALVKSKGRYAKNIIKEKLYLLFYIV